MSGQKSSQFISRLVTGTEKKKTFTEKWVNNKNSTHENRNNYVETNVRISVQWPSRSNKYAGTSMQMFSAPLYCMHFCTQLNQGASVCRLIFLNASIKTTKDITNTHALHSYKNSPTTHFPLCLRWLKKSSTKTKPTLPTPVHLSPE